MAVERDTAFQDFTLVTLTHLVDVQGVAMPAGSRGVIVSTWADGLAYEVEFASPHVVLTIEGTDLQA
jgi:hypothetical protein